MAYTVEYPLTGHDGRPITNRYGRFVAKADAERWLAQNPIAGSVIVPAVGGGYQCTWGRESDGS